jgi:putative membrane protein
MLDVSGLVTTRELNDGSNPTPCRYGFSKTLRFCVSGILSDGGIYGKIYEYPEPGLYFGVPLIAFLGWAVVEFVIIALTQQIDPALAAEPALDRGVKLIQCGIIRYHLILAFNRSMTFAIGELLRGITGALLYIPIAWMVFTRCWQWSAAHRCVRRGAPS